MGLLMDEKEFGMLEEKQQKKYLFKENVTYRYPEGNAS